MSAKPLVVVAGWMGCQQRHLRRYIQLYQRNGLDVLPVIASTIPVVKSTLANSPIQKPDDWPATSKLSSNSPNCLQALAWDVLGEIEKKEPPAVLFHIMSNGGGFVWEHIRNVLDSGSNFDSSTRETLEAIKFSSIRGVVFDSSPAWFGDEENVFGPALSHCSDEDRLKTYEHFGQGAFENETKPNKQRRLHRNQEYFRFLREDPLDIPHLYFYAKNDLLTDYTRIQEIIQFRRKMRTTPVLEKYWEESGHCAHLLHHPEEYANALTNFTKLTLQDSKQQGRDDVSKSRL